MADGYDEEIPDEEKVKIASNFVRHAPPGEFNEVFHDIRVLLGNDDLLKEGARAAFAQYDEEQFTPVEVPGAAKKTLITKHGRVDDSGERYLDPRSAKTFAYDHLKKVTSDEADGERDAAAERHRAAVQEALDAYCDNRYPAGVLAVYGASSGGKITIVACIEDHKYNPNNFWNGRWRSEWTLVVPSGGGEATIKGVMKAAVHYYEDGNVQLSSSKDAEGTATGRSEEDLAKALLKVIEKEENGYQEAINGNYNDMSEKTFKALRRQLPVTRSKLDWQKLLTYKLAAEMSQKN